MNSSLQISAVIITANEETNIIDCINSLKSVIDEIIVVDAISTDKTVELAKEAGAKVFVRKWINFGDQRNFGSQKASNDWILTIDADERLDDNLANEIQSLRLDNNLVYAIDVKTNYLGKWIKHCGWSPNFKKRLYNKNLVKWSNDLVHENLIWTSEIKIKKLEGSLLHYSYPSIERHEEKTEKYAKLTAQKWKLNNKTPGFLKRIFGPGFRFFRTYILKLGILDGKEGYLISKMSALLVRRQLYYFDQLKRKH